MAWFRRGPLPPMAKSHVLLQAYHKDITGLSHGLCMVIASLSHGGYKIHKLVTGGGLLPACHRLIQACHVVVTSLSRGCYKLVTWLLQACHMVVTSLSHGCYKLVTWFLQASLVHVVVTCLSHSFYKPVIIFLIHHLHAIPHTVSTTSSPLQPDELQQAPDILSPSHAVANGHHRQSWHLLG